MDISTLYDIFTQCTGITTDSRKVGKGTIFFALKGENFDGNKFALQALKDGAAYAVVDSEELLFQGGEFAERLILTDNSLATLQALAAEHRRRLAIPILAIVGSNGKTTTTSLIYHILKNANYNVGLAGNIGRSLALQIAEGCTYDYYVIELSSFQLDNMYDFRANIAVLLNITPDHLDRYDNDMQKYTDSKMRIIRNQEAEDAFIYWADDPIIKAELEKYGIKAQKCPFSILSKSGMIGYIDNGTYTLETPTPFNLEQESLALNGKHNMYNSLAAGLATRLAGVSDEKLKESLADFQGVEHRLEKVATVGGVHYINDSKATNVDACWYALESMTTPTILIIGGKDKGNDYEAIRELVAKKCAGLVFLGADNSKLHDFFDPMGIPTFDTHSMKECIEACNKLAKPGYTVLLSPCCASFDLFKNMEDRGEQFKELVRNL